MGRGCNRASQRAGNRARIDDYEKVRSELIRGYHNFKVRRSGNGRIGINLVGSPAYIDGGGVGGWGALLWV